MLALPSNAPLNVGADTTPVDGLNVNAFEFPTYIDVDV